MKQSLRVFLGTFAITFVIYAVLRQDCFYRHDGWGFVNALESGSEFGSAHPFYIPLARIWHSLLALTGIGTFRAAGLLSAFGSAIAVAIHALSLRRLGQRDWVLGCAWVALCPAVLFFASVIEIHGLFLAFASLSFYLCVLLAEMRSLFVAILLAVALAVATGVHASGVLLPLLFLPWYLRKAREHLLLTTATVMVVAILYLSIVWWLLPGGVATDASLPTASDLIRESPRLLPVLWREWLLPFFPVSLLVVFALARRRWRVEAALLLLTLVPYVLTCVLLLQEAPEKGAYLLPWILPASLLALEMCGPWLGRVLVAAGALLGLWTIQAHETARGVDPGWAHHVEQACEGHSSYVLVWKDWEMDSLLLHADSTQVSPIWTPPFAAVTPETQKYLLPRYEQMLGGKKRLLTYECRVGMGQESTSLSGPMLLRFFVEQMGAVELDARGQRQPAQRQPR